jgi:excisionase family DNA binding protein
VGNDWQTTPAAFTIREFCGRYRLSRSTFYNLLSAGEGPRIFRVGNSVRISAEAAEDWRRERESEAFDAA